jgi:hypothetical protein
MVKANDLLVIENDYLGYTIRFWLEELLVEVDGSTYYKGYGQYIDKTDSNDISYIEKRKAIYTHSLPHFLRSLVNSFDYAGLKEYGYEISLQEYENGVFHAIPLPAELNALVQPDSITGGHRLYFPEFLKVMHNSLQISSNNEMQVSVSSAEQQKFGAARSQSIGSDQQHAISRLYKIEPYLLIDKRGTIVNKSAVREYGYWAEQRLASTLPIDYIDFPEPDIKKTVSKPMDTLTVFQDLIGYDQSKKVKALAFLQENWSPEYVAPLLDILRLSRDEWQLQATRKLLDQHVPAIESDYYRGIQWLWKGRLSYGKYYANFKGFLYGALDPAFYRYFHDQGSQATIRLDEIIWGGVRQDGIPPLNSPTMMEASQAIYLSDTDVVFGLVIDGEARAYPKRILAWHEFFTDNIGDQSIAGVYCTLCGTVIIYNTEFNGIKHELGTSGFLYRSNKLMYDRATQSLWSTILGKPVVGPLIDQNIELSTLPIETTNWGEWRRRHPGTKVLSLDTGYSRNYDEGEAYKDYYADDDLMFPVFRLDRRLPNKSRVFIPRPENFEEHPLAISVEYLKRNRLYQDQIGDQRILIITESHGAIRAYAVEDQLFKSYRDGRLLDHTGQEWEVKEEALIGPEGDRFTRLPAHEAFWFAWVNVFPDTRIIR